VSGQSLRTEALLAALPDDAWTAVVDSARGRVLGAGEVLFRAGDAGNELFVIQSGQVEVFVQGTEGPVVVARLGPGEAFGERALGRGASHRRTAGVRGAAPTRLLVVPEAIYQSHVAPHLDQPMADAAVWEALPDLPVLRDLPAVDAGMSLRRFEPGDAVFRAGDPGDAAWFVVEGMAGAVGADGAQGLRRYQRGQCFGELALARGAPRAATVRAETALVALRIEAARFRDLAVSHPPLRALLSTLQYAYSGPDGGTATVRRGVTQGSPSVTSLVRTSRGQVFVATRVEARDLLAFRRHDGGTGEPRVVLFERAAPGERRALQLRNGVPVSLRVVGDTGGLDALVGALYGGRRLSGPELERFRWTGTLD